MFFMLRDRLSRLRWHVAAWPLQLTLWLCHPSRSNLLSELSYHVTVLDGGVRLRFSLTRRDGIVYEVEDLTGTAGDVARAFSLIVEGR